MKVVRHDDEEQADTARKLLKKLVEKYKRDGEESKKLTELLWELMELELGIDTVRKEENSYQHCPLLIIVLADRRVCQHSTDRGCQSTRRGTTSGCNCCKERSKVQPYSRDPGQRRCRSVEAEKDVGMVSGRELPVGTHGGTGCS